MSLGKRLINTGGVSEAACLTEDVNPFTGTSADGGVALYSLDYDASDESGNYDGTPTDVDFGVGGQINYGARFNGSSSKIVTSIDNSDVESFSFWFYFESGTTSGRALGSNVGSSAGNIEVAISTNGTIDLTLQNLRYLTGSGALGSTGWKHIYYDTNRDLYINGVAHTSGTDYTSSFSNSTVLIGALRTNFGFINTDIDQIRFFSRTLDESTNGEVSTLFAETACVHTATTTDNYFPLADGSSDAVAYYKLDNSAEDSVGSNDGTETDIEYRFGRYGQAAVFNGSSSNISIPTLGGSFYDNDFSISLWVNLNSLGGLSTAYLFSGAGSRDIFINFNSGNSGGGISARLYDGTVRDVVYSSAVAGNWYHVVFVRSKTSGLNLYVDGISRDTNTFTGNANALSFTSDGIGGRVQDRNTTDGRIDQVRIFSTALDSDQVSQLYNEKPETDTSNFKTVLYEGNGDTTNPTYISNVGIDLESNGGLVWVKSRTTTYNHLLMDSVRGTTSLTSNDTTDEQSNFNRFQSYEANGFMILANNNADSYKINRVSQDFVAWVWKGGGDAVAGSGSGVTNVSKSVNADAGFSIVEYTGGGSASNTVEHGFDNQTPELIIVKCISDAAFWCVWSSQLTSNYNLALNLTNAQFAANSGSNGGLGDATSSDITFVSGSVNLNTVNGSGRDYIAYCFHSVSGYSKIGSYEGLGTSTVTVSGLGFKPSWIIVKNADDTSNWNIYDSRRSGNDSGWGSMDTMNDILYPNLNIAEVEGGSTHVFTANSDGFVVGASNHLQNNKAGDTFIYMAFK
jgi:hypothetical protein